MTPSRASADWEAFERVTLDYTRVAAGAFSDLCKEKTSDNEAKKFRFIYFSGGLAERDQERSLWLSGGFRKVRVGLSLFLLLSFGLADGWSTYLCRAKRRISFSIMPKRTGTFSSRISCGRGWC